MAMLSPDIVSRIPVGLYGREMDNVAWFVFQEASPELLRFSSANHVQAFQFVKILCLVQGWTVLREQILKFGKTSILSVATDNIIFTHKYMDPIIFSVETPCTTCAVTA